MNTTITKKPSKSDISGRGNFKDVNFFSSESSLPQNPSTAHIAATEPEIPSETNEKLSVITTGKSEFMFPRIGSISKIHFFDFKSFYFDIFLLR